MTTWISGHQEEIKQFGQNLAKGIKDAVTWAKSLDWDKITRSLQAGAGFAKGLIDAFLAAPPWVQTFLAGGFVANKFTGGDAVGHRRRARQGAHQGRAGLTAGVVNIKAATVIGRRRRRARPHGGRAGCRWRAGSAPR